MVRIYTGNPGKSRGPLPRLLAQAGSDYQWFLQLDNPNRQAPEMHACQQLLVQEAESRLQRLRTCVQTVRACLLCAKQDAQHCHQRIITAYLTAYGYVVQQL
jgi:hypothetical protein